MPKYYKHHTCRPGAVQAVRYSLGQIKSRPFMPPHSSPPQCLAGVRVVAQALADGALVQGLVVALQPEHLQAQGLQAGQIGWALCAGV